MNFALFGGVSFVPDVAALQAWLEIAWEAGFDPEGAEQLQCKVLGTRKWIGTTEVAALLRYSGLKAKIIDFLGSSFPMLSILCFSLYKGTHKCLCIND